MGRAVHRRQRTSVPLATLALVGYTNAGKSTLFNRLTEAGVVADARMFATLDPTVRAVTLPSRRRVVLSDTVGFIRNLPTTLVKAFRATLEEVTEATLILHVVGLALINVRMARLMRRSRDHRQFFPAWVFVMGVTVLLATLVARIRSWAVGSRLPRSRCAVWPAELQQPIVAPEARP